MRFSCTRIHRAQSIQIILESILIGSIECLYVVEEVLTHNQVL